MPPAEIQSILRTLQALDISGQSDRSETTNLAPVVRRVDLRKDGIELSVDLESIVPRGADSPPLTITRFIPLRIGRRGVAMRLVFGGGVSARKPDPSLLKAVARGYRWFHEVISDQGILPRDIAARERVNERFVRRLMPLAFLAPAVIEAIVEGRQPPNSPVNSSAAVSRFPSSGRSRLQRSGLLIKRPARPAATLLVLPLSLELRNTERRRKKKRRRPKKVPGRVGICFNRSFSRRCP